MIARPPARFAVGPRPERYEPGPLVRPRRVLELERTFDADPELAAIVADLVDEVERLRAVLLRAGLKAD